jgi:hypothetical protein
VGEGRRGEDRAAHPVDAVPGEDGGAVVGEGLDRGGGDVRALEIGEVDELGHAGPVVVALVGGAPALEQFRVAQGARVAAHEQTPVPDDVDVDGQRQGPRCRRSRRAGRPGAAAASS